MTSISGPAHVTSCPTAEQLHAASSSEAGFALSPIKTSSPGNVSFKDTFKALLKPLFSTSNLYVTIPPATTGFGIDVLVRFKSVPSITVVMTNSLLLAVLTSTSLVTLATEVNTVATAIAGACSVIFISYSVAPGKTIAVQRTWSPANPKLGWFPSCTQTPGPGLFTEINVNPWGILTFSSELLASTGTLFFKVTM